MNRGVAIPNKLVQAVTQHQAFAPGLRSLVCPGAKGCVGFLVELVLAPIINAAGVPAAAGKNTAI